MVVTVQMITHENKVQLMPAALHICSGKYFVYQLSYSYINIFLSRAVLANFNCQFDTV